MNNLQPEHLYQFTGSLTLWKDTFLGGQYTDGVRYLRENGADWFVNTAIYEVRNLVAKMNRLNELYPEFLVISLKRHGLKGAVLTIEDGDEKVLFRDLIPFTDFPLASWPNQEFSIFWANEIFYLPSEH